MAPNYQVPGHLQDADNGYGSVENNYLHMTDKERRDMLLSIRDKTQKDGVSTNRRSLNHRIASLPAIKPALTHQSSQKSETKVQKNSQTNESVMQAKLPDTTAAVKLLTVEQLESLHIAPRVSDSVPTLKANLQPRKIPRILPDPQPSQEPVAPLTSNIQQSIGTVKRAFKSQQISSNRFSKMTNHEQISRFLQ